MTTGIERQPSPEEPLFASFYLPEKPASAPGRGQVIAPTIYDDNGTLSQGKAQTSHTRKVGVIGAAVVAVLLLVGLGFGIIHQSFTPQHTGSVPTQKQPVNGSATPLSSTTSQASPPLLGQQYIGGISDLVTNTTTAMTLTQISQSAGQIRGNFSGLGLTGPFAGTIDTRDNIHFQVTIYGGTETIDFEGIIKLGGTLAGSYRVLRNQQFTGESGVWSVSP